MSFPPKARALIKAGLKPLTKKVENGEIIVHYKIVRLGKADGPPIALFGKKFATVSDAKVAEAYRDDPEFKKVKGNGLVARGVLRLTVTGDIEIVPATKDNRVLAGTAVVRHFKELQNALKAEKFSEVGPTIQKIVTATPKDAADTTTMVTSSENEDAEDGSETPPQGSTDNVRDDGALALASEGEAIVRAIDQALSEIPGLRQDQLEGAKAKLDDSFEGLLAYTKRLDTYTKGLGGPVGSVRNADSIALLTATRARVAAAQDRLVTGYDKLEARQEAAEEEARKERMELEASAKVKNAETKQLNRDYNAAVGKIATFLDTARPVEDGAVEEWKAEGAALELQIARIEARGRSLHGELSGKTFSSIRVSDSLELLEELLARAGAERRALHRVLNAGPHGPPEAAESDYNDALESAKPLTDKAVRLSDIGGATVKRKLHLAAGEAKKKRYTAAVALVEAAAADAAIVVEREVYVRAYQSYRYLIKAAMAVKLPVGVGSSRTHGDVVKERWDGALAKAKPGSYKQAGIEVEALAKYVRDKIDGDEGLKAKRTELATQKALLRTEMDELAQVKTPSDAQLARMRALAVLELKRSADERAAGVDPTAELMTPLTDEASIKGARALFRAFDWFKLKEKAHDPSDASVNEAVQKDLWRFRQEYVTKLIDEVREEVPELIAKASGSTDLESDIDITFATPRSGDDVAAAKKFNDQVKKDFGKPPGRTFDVNIYIREYGTIKESFNEFHEVGASPDENLTPQRDPDMDKLTQIDQDVATLLKQRRFQSDTAFDLTLQALLSGITGKADRADVRRRYEEAESNYYLTLQAKLEGIEQRLRKGLKATEDTGERARLVAALKEIEKLNKIANPARRQRKMQDAVAKLERDFPSETMEATDEMYLERMAQLRGNEALVRKLESPVEDAAAEHDGKPCSEAHTGAHDAWRRSKIAALKVQIKKDITTNIVFANEAYISEGAIEHVVMTGQGDMSQKEKEAKIRAMPTTKLLQSTNEQLADFYKEMEKYTAETLEAFKSGDETATRRIEGEAYVHSSKYVSRLLDAGIALALKYEDAEPPLELDWVNEIPMVQEGKISKQLGDLKASIDDLLLSMRKSSSLSSALKAEVAVAELRTLLDVTDIGDFTALFERLGTELNARVRAREDFKVTQAVEKEKEKEYFEQRERPLRERALGSLRGLVEAREALHENQMRSTLTDLQIEGAVVLSSAWGTAVGAMESLSSAAKRASARIAVSNLRGLAAPLAEADTEVHRIFIDHCTAMELDIERASRR